VESTDRNNNRTTKWMRYAARTLALLWAGWWVFFGLASGLGEGLSPVGILIHTALPGLVFLVSVALAWRWETVGGVVLILEGVFVLIAYPVMTYDHFPLATIIFVLLTMALPPLAAGLLLLISGQKSKAPEINTSNI